MNTWIAPVSEPYRPYDPDEDLTIRCAPQIQFNIVAPDHASIYRPEHVPLKYVCYSCYSACGDRDACFATETAYRKDMVAGPTQKQQDQMTEHARQHSIIWSWARQQDKR